MNAYPLRTENVVCTDRAVGCVGCPIGVDAWPQEQADLVPPAVHCPCLIYDNGVVREEPNDCIHVATVAG